MGKIVAITGKGGTGKTTVSSLLLRALVKAKRGAVLAVDSDPNANLAEALGLKVEETISAICEEMLKKEEIPAGMSKERFLEYRIQQSLVERENLSLLTMGRPEGPGCYCYANNLLRQILKELVDNYKYTLIDNAAGMEHLSRKTVRRIDTLFVVSDFSAIGIRSAGRIYNLAKEMEISLGESFLLVNKVRGDIAGLKKEIEDSGLLLAGSLPFLEEIEDLSIKAQALWDLPPQSVVWGELERLAQQIIL